MIGAVVFDVGECLVDETRGWGAWADWLGVPRHVFSAVFGAAIARGQDYRETFPGLPAASDDWHVSKPDPGFFRKMIEVSPRSASETLYVGDRLDNDILPAAEAGLRTALIRRGPWAMIWQDDPAASRVPTMRVDSLAELPGKIGAFNAGAC